MSVGLILATQELILGFLKGIDGILEGVSDGKG